MKVSVQVDLDALWTYRRYLKNDDASVPEMPAPDPVFTQALPLFLGLFEKYGFRATFFVTGCDVAQEKHREILRRAVRAGHEIASHSQTHPRDFAALNTEDIRKEIVESRRVLQEACRTPVDGFRAPTFSLSGEVLRILEQEKFIYDASVIPSFFNPLFLKLAHSLFSKRLNRDNMGSFLSWNAGRRPYYPDLNSIFRKGDSGLLEIPIGVLPLLRLPVHSSYVFLCGEWLFDLAFSLYRDSETPFCYLFHGIDLLDLKKYGLTMPGGNDAGKKARIVDNVLRKIKQRAVVRTARQLADDFASGRRNK